MGWGWEWSKANEKIKLKRHIDEKEEKLEKEEDDDDEVAFNLTGNYIYIWMPSNKTSWKKKNKKLWN